MSGVPNATFYRTWHNARHRRRWETPVLPIPPHIKNADMLRKAAQLSGTQTRTRWADGYVNLAQAERIAAAAHKHPFEIWGPLWVDLGELDNNTETAARRLHRFATQWTPQ